MASGRCQNPDMDPTAFDALSVLQTAVDAHRAGSLDVAEQDYRTVLASDPDNPDALHLLGVVYRDAGPPRAGGGTDPPRTAAGTLHDRGTHTQILAMRCATYSSSMRPPAAYASSAAA